MTTLEMTLAKLYPLDVMDASLSFLHRARGHDTPDEDYARRQHESMWNRLPMDRIPSFAGSTFDAAAEARRHRESEQRRPKFVEAVQHTAASPETELQRAEFANRRGRPAVIAPRVYPYTKGLQVQKTLRLVFEGGAKWVFEGPITRHQDLTDERAVICVLTGHIRGGYEYLAREKVAAVFHVWKATRRWNQFSAEANNFGAVIGSNCALACYYPERDGKYWSPKTVANVLYEILPHASMQGVL